MTDIVLRPQKLMRADRVVTSGVMAWAKPATEQAMREEP